MSSQVLYSSFQLGPTQLKNRVVMAPMTRSRSTGNVPGEMVARYYAQRSEAGLIITEGTAPSPNGLGYARIPGLFNSEHVKAWKGVTDAVHKEGSKIFVQLMHTGRVGHPLNLPAGARVLGPSAVALKGEMYTDAQGPQPHPTPEMMTEADILAAIEEFARSAELALKAGFDGVELHGANGYLIDQFLNAASNTRRDTWGGSVENRVRFAVEVARATAKRIGNERVGMRLSPYGAFNGTIADDATPQLYALLASELKQLGLVYVHIVDHATMGAPAVPVDVKRSIQKEFGGTIILSGGYDAARAEAGLAEKHGELVAFGRPFISNPRLVSKMRSGTPLVPPDMTRLYTPGESGYTDYPVA